MYISIHALRVEGDNTDAIVNLNTQQISIHALRVEGDELVPKLLCKVFISIHALRVEGDRERLRASMYFITYFYPRPPGGGRHRTLMF